MLGFDWFCTFNPHFNWWACTFLVKIPGRHHIPAGVSCNSIERVEPASLDSICKEVNHGVIAWFMLVHLVEPPDSIGACNTLARGESGDA